MWCEKCQAEVAAEVARGGRIQCATCSSDIAPSRSLRATSRTQEARDLLERWSKQPPLDPFGPVMSDKQQQEKPEPRSYGDEASHHSAAVIEPGQPLLRVDSPHADEQAPQAPSKALVGNRSNSALEDPPQYERDPVVTLPPPSAAPATVEEPPEYRQPPPAAPAPVSEPERLHTPHSPSAQAPHFDVQSFVGQGEQKSNFVALAGQFLAYGGVALLTVGTVLVLWGYFGGPEGYTPTGWLISTAGQMLLFLGIITLVSGGIEHTAEQMRSEIRLLGDKMIRIERASRDHALKGPSIPAEQFEQNNGNARRSSDSRRTGNAHAAYHHSGGSF